MRVNLRFLSEKNITIVRTVNCMQTNSMYFQNVKTTIRLNAATVCNASTCGTCVTVRLTAGILAMKLIVAQVTCCSRASLTDVTDYCRPLASITRTL